MSDLSPYPVQNVDTAVFFCYGCHLEEGDTGIFNTKRREEKGGGEQNEIKKKASKRV